MRRTNNNNWESFAKGLINRGIVKSLYDLEKYEDGKYRERGRGHDPKYKEHRRRAQ